MLSGSQIRNISDVAAYRAAEDGALPLTYWKAEDIPHTPFLGRYVPAGYRVATAEDFPTMRSDQFYAFDDEVWVEAGGWGDHDPTDTLLTACNNGAYWAIVESGQFQTYLRAYIRDDDAPAQNLPDEDAVTCSECGTVHNDLEECNGPYCDACGADIAYQDDPDGLCNACCEDQDEDGELPLFAN